MRPSWAVAWTAARIRVGTMAVLVAALTGLGASMGSSGVQPALAFTYMLLTAITLVRGDALAVQIVVGLVLCGSALGVGAGTLWVALLLCGVVVAAELSAIAFRLSSAGGRDPRADIGKALMAAAVGGLVFMAMTAVVVLPGPSGIAGVAMGAAGCVLLAFGIARNAGSARSQRPDG